MATVDIFVAFLCGIIFVLLIICSKNMLMMWSSGPSGQTESLLSRSAALLRSLRGEPNEGFQSNHEGLNANSSSNNPLLQVESASSMGRFSREWKEGGQMEPLSPTGAKVIKTLVPFSFDQYHRNKFGGVESFANDPLPPPEIIASPPLLTERMCRHEKDMGVYV